MKILNKKYKGTIHSNGKFPKTIEFDNLTNNDIPFLLHIGMDFLTVEICDECGLKRCKCNKGTFGENMGTLSRKKRKKKNDTDK